MILLAAIAHAACPASLEALSARLESAEEAFGSMKLEPFRTELAAIEEEVGCLEVRLEPVIVGRLHRVRAMGAFLDRDQPGAVQAFQAQRAADGELGLPEKYVEQHPLRKLYEQAADEEDPTSPLQLVDGVQIWVDGHAAEVRPTGRTALFQFTSADSLLGSQLLAPGAGIEVPTPVPAPAPVPPESTGKAKKKAPVVTIGLGVLAGVAAGSAVGLYASGRSSYARYQDPATPFEDLDGLRSKTNQRHVGAQIAGLGALGFGTAAVLSGVL